MSFSRQPSSAHTVRRQTTRAIARIANLFETDYLYIYSNTYLILTEYEVNIGNRSRVKDRGEAEVFYKVFISYTDQVRSQY